MASLLNNILTRFFGGLDRLTTNAYTPSTNATPGIGQTRITQTPIITGAHSGRPSVEGVYTGKLDPNVIARYMRPDLEQDPYPEIDRGLILTQSPTPTSKTIRHESLHDLYNKANIQSSIFNPSPNDEDFALVNSLSPDLADFIRRAYGTDHRTTLANEGVAFAGSEYPVTNARTIDLFKQILQRNPTLSKQFNQIIKETIRENSPKEKVSLFFNK